MTYHIHNTFLSHQGPADSQWSNVLVLCPLIGADGSTAAPIDIGPYGRQITASSVTTIINNSTAPAYSTGKFGRGAAYSSSGTNVKMDVAATSGSEFTFAAGVPWTYDGWFYFTADTNGYQEFLRIGAEQAQRLVIAKSSTGSPFIFDYFNSGTIGTGWTISTGAWHYHEINRDSSGTIRWFVNGTIITTISGWNVVMGNSVNPCWRFTLLPGCYASWVRLTRGVARNVSNYTAPTTNPPTHG